MIMISHITIKKEFKMLVLIGCVVAVVFYVGVIASRVDSTTPMDR